MKAVYIEERGGPEALIYGDAPDPEMRGDDSVLIRIRAASVNRFDLNARAGENGVMVGLPRILGLDLAGEVLDAGAAALEAGILPGARVVADPRMPCQTCSSCRSGRDEDCGNRFDLGSRLDGTYAEMIAVPARSVHAIPDTLSFEDAAAMPIVFKTAWRMLTTKARAQPGETVLVHAIGSGVGTAALQIAKLLGCRVIATAGADWKLDRALEMGADETVNYADPETWPEIVLALTEGEGVDVIIDSVGAPLWDGSFRVLGRQGRFVTCGVTAGHRVSLHLGQTFLRGLEIMGIGGFRTSDFETVMRLTRQGMLRGTVGRVFPLSEAAEAHRLMESRDFFGKIVLTT